MTDGIPGVVDSAVGEAEVRNARTIHTAGCSDVLNREFVERNGYRIVQRHAGAGRVLNRTAGVSRGGASDGEAARGVRQRNAVGSAVRRHTREQNGAVKVGEQDRCASGGRDINFDHADGSNRRNRIGQPSTATRINRQATHDNLVVHGNGTVDGGGRCGGGVHRR